MVISKVPAMTLINYNNTLHITSGFPFNLSSPSAKSTFVTSTQQHSASYCSTPSSTCPSPALLSSPLVSFILLRFIPLFNEDPFTDSCALFVKT